MAQKRSSALSDQQQFAGVDLIDCFAPRRHFIGSDPAGDPAGADPAGAQKV
jgi:hypothetical protein